MSASAFRFARVLIPHGHRGDDAARGRADGHHLQSQDSDLGPGRLRYPGSIYDLAGQALKSSSKGRLVLPTRPSKITTVHPAKKGG
jgi:hypothetical protein